jgi:hypothetical protein
MAWPEPLVELLARPGSPASQALRWGLHGLRASLQTALGEIATDPAVEHLGALVAELDRLIEGTGAASPSLLPPDASDGHEPKAALEPPPVGPRLLALTRAIVQDERLRAHLKGSFLADGDDEQIWGEAQRLLLRVPAALADEWRHRSQALAEQAGGRLDEWAAASLPLPWDEAIYPGVTGEIRAAGLRSVPTAALGPRVTPPADGDFRLLAGVVSTYLWFVEHDPYLQHCLKSVFRFGVSPLTGDQRERYVTELLRLWERVRTATAESQAGPARQQHKERIKALLDLDEALHSLVYLPPADPGSWWGRLLSQVRQTLFPARDRAIQAGCPVHLQVLGGNFADINRLAPDSLQVDFGIAGEVSTCLRVWARIDGEELKGRVLYRSPQEEA